MTNSSTMWNILKTHVPRREWISITDIFRIVESQTSFDDDDLRLNSRNIPAWKLTVRRVLSEKRDLGSIQARRSESNH